MSRCWVDHLSLRCVAVSVTSESWAWCHAGATCCSGVCWLGMPTSPPALWMNETSSDRTRCGWNEFARKCAARRFYERAAGAKEIKVSGWIDGDKKGIGWLAVPGSMQQLHHQAIRSGRTREHNPTRCLVAPTYGVDRRRMDRRWCVAPPIGHRSRERTRGSQGLKLIQPPPSHAPCSFAHS
jgi:hypothetical protein